jgi:hypothetical protein
MFSKFIEDCAKVLYIERKKKMVHPEGEAFKNEEEQFIYQIRKLNKRSGFTEASIHYLNILENQEYLKLIEKEQNQQIQNALARFQTVRVKA